MFTKKVGATGASFYIILPKAILEDRGIEKGDSVVIDIVDVIKRSL